jgi:hypothetical protein
VCEAIAIAALPLSQSWRGNLRRRPGVGVLVRCRFWSLRELVSHLERCRSVRRDGVERIDWVTITHLPFSLKPLAPGLQPHLAFLHTPAAISCPQALVARADTVCLLSYSIYSILFRRCHAAHVAGTGHVSSARVARCSQTRSWLAAEVESRPRIASAASTHRGPAIYSDGSRWT